MGGPSMTAESHERRPGAPRFFYHVSTSYLEPGHLLTPEGAAEARGGLHRDEPVVYITSSSRLAVQLVPQFEELDGKPAHIYAVKPTGPYQDDPELTHAELGNPLEAYITRHPVQVIGCVMSNDTYPAVDLHAGRLADVKRAREDITISWITNEVREYKATFTGVELRAAGLTVSNGRLEQAEPPQSHWETPDRFLANHEGPDTQKAGYVESRIAEAYPAGADAESKPDQGGSASPRLPGGPDFTGAPVAQRNASRDNRPPGSRVAPNAGQARPGRLR